MKAGNRSLPNGRKTSSAAGQDSDGHTVEDVEVKTWNPFLPHDMTDEQVKNRRLWGKGRLFLPHPKFPRPRPAVVIVQGLGGPKKQREIAYGHLLAREGYIALLINSFATRRMGKAPQIWRALNVTTAMLMADAFAGLEYLSNHPLVAPGRIGVTGFSFGGMVSVLTAYRQMHELYLPGGPAFAAHVSYYGSSIPRLDNPQTTGAPVLIMLGLKDKNVSIQRTEQIAEDLRSGGSRVDLVKFDAFHQWDGPYKNPYRNVFHLRDCRIRIGVDGSVRDETNGRAIKGFWSRLFFLLRNSVLYGYLIQRDPAIIGRSNALLLSFLKEELSSGRP